MVIYGDVGGVGDYRAFALKRARQLGVFLSAPQVFEDNFLNVPGDAGSQFQTITQIGAAGTVTGTGAAGGVIRLDSTAAASKGVLVQPGKATGTKPTMIPDPTASGSRWYLLWVFSIASTFDAQTVCTLNMLTAAGTGNELFIGFDGQFSGSTTNFMVEDNSSATISTITPGSAGTWHYLEAWQTGVTKVVNFSFDSEPAKSLTMTTNSSAPVVIQFEAANGTTAASRQLDVDHVVVLMPGNVTLPNT